MFATGEFINKYFTKYTYIPYLSYDGNIFERIEQTKYYHSYSGLGIYQGNALTTGCMDCCEGCNVKTEIYDMTSKTWFDADDYPFTTR